MAVWLSDAQRAANGLLSRAQIAERRLKVHLGHRISTILSGRGAWFSEIAGQPNGGSTLCWWSRELPQIRDQTAMPPI